VLDKVVPLAFGPIVDIYETLFFSISEHVKTVARKTDSKESLDRELAHTRLMLPTRHGVLTNVHDKLEKLTEQLNKAKKDAGEIMSEFSVSKNVDAVNASVSALALDLFYTISVDEAVVANPSERSVHEAWRRAKSKLLHDALLDMTSVIRDILTEAVLAPVQSKFLASPELKRIVDPIDKLIPEVVQEFVSAQSLVDEVVDGVVQDTVAKAVGSGMGEATGKLTKMMEVA